VAPAEFAAVAFGTLFSIVDPFAAVPVFLSLAGREPPIEQRRIAVRAAVTSFAILSLFAAAGAFVFSFFGITIPAFRIAGGVILFGVALEMVKAQKSSTRSTQGEIDEEHADVGIVPMGMPLLSGPGSIAAVMVLAARGTTFADRLALHGVILAIAVISWLVLRSAGYFGRALGQTGLNVLSRMMGLLLAAVAVQFVLDGVREAFPFAPSFQAGPKKP
jgi:multiple antibiotic resistance protein